MKVLIIYFSGTGNTKLISGLMLKEFEKIGTIELISVEDILNKKVIIDFFSEEILLGIGFPVYDLSAPEIINKVVAMLPKAKVPIPVFIFSTMGLIMGDCQSILAKKLKIKGYYTIAKIAYICPSNGVSIYEKKNQNHSRFKNVRFEENIDNKIKKFVKDAKIRFERFRLKPFHMIGLTLSVFNLVRYISSKLYGDKYYKNLAISSKCTQCMACVSQCPDNNLVAKNDKIIINKDNGCLRCLRCVAKCPQRAINFTSSPRYGDYNKSIIDKLYKEAN